MAKIQYIFVQEDHHQALLLQECTKEGRTNIEQLGMMRAVLAETCGRFCKNGTFFYNDSSCVCGGNN